MERRGKRGRIPTKEEVLKDTEEALINFNDNLRRECMRRGLRNVAEKAGISPSYLRAIVDRGDPRIPNGQVRVSLEYAIIIADALETTLDEMCEPPLQNLAK
ncbi:hypothetical protein A2686_01695 [Candidatus Woesebacteria bacterium RIFCSPHIGHO2_01_FULL_38_10]|uniref:HTH cro/C1-type domain-containing protein n=1 Tax=Candidatus Woesebacteria bacterium RIFCSPLOWO2_01_FULL_39_10b TaxID=1802517 RepID=A0A1F8B8D8_9BACT|nr:MAG: hypothetical protein A2686_01695 [Candidatus Woesebacteria bacterium RIFCSPHIGHO2_01_FULL_38_10]OGM59608.1 MAG: hypothetical protein A2892_04660 [Candidatus Woesebacteria bacterium RIFCSPLOWO2_01_FULL_39_10b]